ncbi:alpha/beta hydrolase [Castellaniella sp.]|uniref:alpha/beta fold hydrolase n=1 Tax=Castellaniella sp. TaxID=1955812 RepID=UPI002AFED4F6|nr:alpha/beta hydrolase [Castellaniella sp.]
MTTFTTSDNATLFYKDWGIHGDDVQIVPLAASAELAVGLVNDGTLKIYPGGSHGLAQTDADQFNADVLAFIHS